jgi:hypothetical protein
LDKLRQLWQLAAVGIVRCILKLHQQHPTMLDCAAVVHFCLLLLLLLLWC